MAEFPRSFRQSNQNLALKSLQESFGNQIYLRLKVSSSSLGMKFLLLLISLTLIEGNETKKLGLVMIVENDVKILPRLINSVKDHVHTFMICDIGSTDGTQDYLSRLFSSEGSLRGAVLRHQFQDYSTNKNLCLQAAETLEPRMDYFLIPESDYKLVVKSASWINEIAHDYNLIGIEGDLFYRTGILISADKKLRFKGRTYEVLKITDETPPSFSREDFNGISFINNGDAHQRKGRSERDVDFLSIDHQENPTDARTIFNLARVYESLQMYDSALEYYTKRIEMKGWYEEVWYSLYKIGVCKVMRNDNFDSYVGDFLESYDALMTRAEPLFWLTRMARYRKRYGLCIMFGYQGMVIKDPSETHQLFVEKPVYKWMIKDEVSQCLGWIGSFEESKKLIEELLLVDSIPKQNREMIQANLKWCNDQIEFKNSDQIEDLNSIKEDLLNT